jgi:predicted permease
MNGLLQDIRYALRQMRKSPGFTTVVVLTLALGIGANIAIFSVMNALLLRYLPVSHPEQLVYLQTHGMPWDAFESSNPLYTFSLTTFERLRADNHAFSDVVAFVPLGIGGVPVRIGNDAQAANGDMVSGNFFSGLGVYPLTGRIFSAEDEVQHSGTVILNYDYWARRFNRDPNVVGQTIYIQSVPFTVAGVAPRDFSGVEPNQTRTDFWIPFQTDSRLKAWGNNTLDHSPDRWWFLMLMGRLQPGMNLQSAIAQENPVFQRAAYEGIGSPHQGEHMPQLGLAVTGGLENLRENYENPFAILMAMVGFVLLIACVNVAMLLLARNAARQREFSVRVALGEGWTQLFRQLFIEALFLTAVGSALAWIFATGATSALAIWAELEIPVIPDKTVLLFTLLVAFAVAILLGFAPLRKAVGAPVGLAVKSNNVSSEGPKSSRTGQIVLVCQVALCMMLLAGAGLLVRTLQNLQSTDLGFRPSGLVVFGVKPPQGLRDDTQVLAFFHTLTDRLKGLPGVEGVTVMGNRIGSGWSNNTNVYVDGVEPQENKGSMVRWNDVGPDYCNVLGIPLLDGRDFRDSDSATAPKVAIINQTFANWYLPGTNPIGHQIQIARTDAATIIGVVADSKYTGVREVSTPMAYVPYTQQLGTTKTIMVRTNRNMADLLPELRHAVASFGPDMALLKPTTQEAQLEESYLGERLFARIAMFFGLLAGLLVATGLYGTLAYKVSKRTADIGVRMALGARPREVLWMVMRESLVISAAGIAIGLPVALFSSRVLSSMLYKLSPFDPISFVLAAGCILLAASAAAYIPARRAAKVDPMVALRYE